MRTVQDGATWRRRNYGTRLRRPATRARRDDGSISEIPAPASAMTADRFAIRTRMRDPGLVAAPSADAATVRVTFEYVSWATVWLLVGTTIGLIASIKLHWPEFLPYAWLSFGRVRPAHTSLVLLGWASPSTSCPARRASPSGARASPGSRSGSGTWPSSAVS